MRAHIYLRIMFHEHGAQVSGMRGTTRRIELLNVGTNVPTAAVRNVDTAVSKCM